MSLMDRALLWFVRIWVGVAIDRVADLYSPFNLINWLMEVVLISPALGAYAWLEQRRKSH